MPDLNISSKTTMEDLIAKTKAYVKEYMSGNDASHDYGHVQRVLYWAQKIEAAQLALHPTTTYNSHLIILASLLHDVGDRKYLPAGHDPHASDRLAADFLLANGADAALARHVQLIVTHVSYSAETQDPARVRRLIAEIPELAIVQDADRLDALGAVGIARCFTFGGAMRPDHGLADSLAHFENKLEKLLGMMKTETGRAEAEVRTRRLQ
ncbi:hypothetical protein MMC07_009733, partial [Pseudocyphellaria aurata]|nr:hypothetical protein [Pseudocyphellaria aurata]